MNFDTDSLWLEIAVVSGLTSFGSIFFGHFEEHTPKWRRVLKLILLNLVTILLSAFLGRAWSFGFLGLLVTGVIYIHGIWLPRKGINGLTGEPKSKYYALRGWAKYLQKHDDSTESPG